ncbi:MAG: transferrin-binding protein-like solute binding protein [Sulfurospirillum cavolei]|nr:transferrin-binding protein-like solute binding protein [Sulfurospirillum cavolei]
MLAKHDVDIFLLADNTGSMGGLVGSAQTNAQAILDALRADSRFAKVNAQFGVGRYLGDPSEGGETATSSYQLIQPITNSDTAVTTAINQWYASGGGDWEEGNFYAIQQVIDSGAATPRNASLASGQVTNWRTGAQKVIVVFGDAPSWQNSVNEKELKALAIAAGAKIVFIDTSGINVGQTSNVYASTSGQQMQDAAVEIADATGGSYMRLTDVSNIQDAVLNAIYDAVADNKWTGGMVSKIDSTIWRVRTPSSVTASSDASGKILTFTLTYPNQSDSTFSIDTASAAHVVGTEYYQGSISDATSIFGQDMSSASVFHANSDQDFFRYILQNGSSTVEGYYGERLSSSSKLPTSGVSTYDIRERVVSPYTKTSYASDTMKLFVNWATGKVYGFDTNALMDNAEGTAIFVGDIDRAALEISGNYTFKTRRLSASESSNLPRVIKDAMRDTTTLQLYGNAYPNGMGGTFGATYYSESGTPSLSSMMMSGYVNTKTVAKSYTPSDGEVWSGHAVGFVANRSTGAVAIDASTTTDDVQMTLKPSTGEVKASITVTDGSTNRTLTTDYTDTNVYVNQNAFVAMKDSGSVPTYAATTMSENDSYNYLSWGTWSTELSASNKTVVDGSRWIAGKLTPTTSMPSSGTATYNGTVQGMSYESGALKTLNGTHTMNANFASGTITGTMNVNYASSGASYATTNLNAVSISGNGFAGGLNGTDNTGSIKGSFYGPAANEIGGTWALSKTGSSAAGIFAGKK